MRGVTVALTHTVCGVVRRCGAMSVPLVLSARSGGRDFCQGDGATDTLMPP